ncbi:pantothenate kinase, partial [mine drainage metagenome]
MAQILWFQYFFDFSIYVDADESIIKEWFIERFLKLMETAFRDPRSYFKNYSNISRDD